MQPPMHRTVLSEQRCTPVNQVSSNDLFLRFFYLTQQYLLVCEHNRLLKFIVTFQMPSFGLQIRLPPLLRKCGRRKTFITSLLVEPLDVFTWAGKNRSDFELQKMPKRRKTRNPTSINTNGCWIHVTGRFAMWRTMDFFVSSARSTKWRMPRISRRHSSKLLPKG